MKKKDQPKEKTALVVPGKAKAQEVECRACIESGSDPAEVTFDSVQEFETHRAAAHRAGR